MSALLVGAAVSLLVVMTAVSRREESERLAVLRVPRPKTQRPTPVDLLGRQLVRISIARRYAKNETYRRGLTFAFMIVVPLALVRFKTALLVGVLILIRPYLAERQAKANYSKAVLRDLPVATEMVRLAISSGLNINRALEHLVRHTKGPFAVEFGRVLSDTQQGHRIAAAIEAAGKRLGEDAYPLTNALVSAERYGAPLSDSLERLALESRRDQERRAEQAGQKLAVKLIFPVAVTTLPAFVALTLPPLIAGSLGSLALHTH